MPGNIFELNLNNGLYIGLSMALMGALILQPVSLGAQTVNDAQVPDTTLNIPEQMSFFAENNPNERKATAIVNGEIITGTDVDQRMALIIDANKNASVTEEEMVRLRLQVLRNLIDETLQIQEALANEIEVTRGEVDEYYTRTAKSNFGRSAREMNAHLTSIGSSARSLKRQITGELAWQRLLNRNIVPMTNVSEEEVNELIRRLKASKGTFEYHVGEIYISASDENRNERLNNISQIAEQLQLGGSFQAYARQFSEASSKSVGGDLGWIRPGQLPQSLAQAVTSMQVGQMVGPVEIPGGYSLLLLQDKRQVLTSDARDARLSLKQLAIQFPKDIGEQGAERLVENFTTQTSNIRGCGDADAVAAQIGADVVNNDNVVVRSLPGPLQGLFLNLQVGETTQPFGSLEQGLRVFVLCGRDDSTQEIEPDAVELMSQMEDEKVNRRAQIYLRDLRRDAIIEYN